MIKILKQKRGQVFKQAMKTQNFMMKIISRKSWNNKKFKKLVYLLGSLNRRNQTIHIIPIFQGCKKVQILHQG